MKTEAQRDLVAVYGASGYTGRQVARCLLERGQQVVLCGRSPESLERSAAGLPGRATVMVAALDDPRALAALAAQVGLVINCAGPFSASALPLCRAALAQGAHYLDVSAEQASTQAVLDQDAAAKRAGVVLLPAFGFFGALADLLIAGDAADHGTPDAIEVAYSVSGWLASAATVRTRIEGLGGDFWIYDRGPVVQRGLPPTRFFDFPAPLGRKRVVVYPTPEVVTLPRHVAARRMQIYMTATTLGPAALGPLLPTAANLAGVLIQTPLRAGIERLLAAMWGAQDPGSKQTDPTRFVISIALEGAGGARRLSVTGSGIYDITAVMAAEAAVQLLSATDGRAGALAPGQAFDPASMLASIAADSRSARPRLDFHAA